MSARRLPGHCEGDEIWEILLSYKGKTRDQWRTVLLMDSSEREAQSQAEKLWNQDSAAIDFMVVPLQCDLEREEFLP